ncbi:MAG: lysophospholipid acyltransferase family protein [Vicinamibacterales bacterium]|nr:lysophospholipid acyltransferase family protein [Vicinamibacterales bacterium]MDP7478002.1 lysophospholipid acyltransferase family protein [Vicinamibacterales bacterium]MDP7690449.1 lysophospholipid acyltransferase family protein [Vicinamibacterales bacterium]HJN43476.1 lysophospholipid acyltransferase family protein [Vicinamibacterales bacterium]
MTTLVERPAASMRRHRPVRHRLEYLAVLGIRLAVGLVSRRWLVWAGARLGSLFHRFDRRRRETAVANVRAAFPVRTDAECRTIVRGAFENLGRHVLDLLRFDTMSVEQMMDLVEFEGEDRVEQALATGRGVMFYTGHFGFWELQIMVHAVRFAPIIMVARSLDNPLLEALIERVRTRVGTRVIPRQGAVRGLLRGLLEHQAVGMMIDQHMQDRSAVNVEFFNRPAATTSSIAALALRTGVPVIPVFALPLPGGRYRLIYETPVELPAPESPDAVRTLTQRCTDVLEMYVRRYPELWLWMHRRWRVADETAAGGGTPSTGARVGAEAGEARRSSPDS